MTSRNIRHRSRRPPAAPAPRKRLSHLSGLCLILCGLRAWAAAPSFDFHAPVSDSAPGAAAAMRDLAQRILPVYQESDPASYLDNLSALQLVAGDYAAAHRSRQSLRNRRRADMAHPLGQQIVYDVYAYASALEAQDKIPFADGFARAFDALVAHLPDSDAFAVAASLEQSAQPLHADLQSALDRQRAKDNIAEQDAVALIWKYLAATAYRSFGPLVAALDAEDDRRRYATDGDIQIKAADGVVIDAMVVRPRGAAKRLPALLEFTIGRSAAGAKESAAHGFAGVVASARRSVPFQHDGSDARAVINWAARQPWSDGRVVMYGFGYGGFAAWSAAAQRPHALKAIATTAPGVPGIDFPMSGGIFKNPAFGWSARITGAAGAAADDEETWRALDRKWYRSGLPYRDLGRLYGRPNPIFQRWLNHPSFDRFWQSMTPTPAQFARIDIPVLSVTGYFAASEPAALYLFREHRRANPRSDHTLVIGPYDDQVLQRGSHEPRRDVPQLLRGYAPDPAAAIDLHELRYQWFDHVLSGGPAPQLLRGRIAFEVMGANEWRNAPSLDAMSTGALRLHLGGAASDGHVLAGSKSDAVIEQILSFTDREDAGWTAPIDLVTRSPDVHDAVEFVSEPLAAPLEVIGAFSGRLDFEVNKADFDLFISLYERAPDGQYTRLFDPAYELRASYAHDRTHRRLLQAGVRQRLVFTSERMTGRRLQAGSRLVLVLGSGKRPDREINYGTGGDVSAESMADGGTPLKIRWYGASYVDIPVRK